MGIGRFAFTPLLPMMQADAGVTLAQGGWLASANYAGYLAGALWAALRPLPAGRAIRLGLAAIALTTLAMGVVQAFPAWLALRCASGVASAWVLVHVSGWALARLVPLGRPVLTGIVYAGVGSGVALAGACCAALLLVSAGSRTAWLVLGALAVLLSVPAWRAAHDAREPVQASGQGSRGAPWDIVACYAVSGFGYIVPATYLPVLAREALGGDASFTWAWPVFGLAAAGSTLAVAPVLAYLSHRRVWSLCHLLMAAGVIAPLVVPGLAGVLAAALCVGSTFVVSTMTGLQEGRRLAGTGALAPMTAAFSGGQVLGPLASNALLHAGATLYASLAVAGALLAATALYLYVTHPEPS